MSEPEKRSKVKEWTNVKTDEDGFTALHFASFRGIWRVVSMLMENGSNMHALNKDGLNMLHTAA